MIFHRLYFLRNPKRAVPEGNVVVSPANGRIARIIETGKDDSLVVDKGLLGKVRIILKDMPKSCYIVVIVMTPLNVHYQRSPVSGIVERVSYMKGKFLDAMKDASSLVALENEKNEIVIVNNQIGKVKVIQVAGFLARRIRCFVEKRQKLDKGQDLGVICLGSQVILAIPKLKLMVKEGQKVIDGETIIARF